MMRGLILIVALPLALAAVAYADTTPAPTPEKPSSRISVTATIADVHSTHEHRTDLLLLWNRDITNRPIGHAILTCVKVGIGGILGSRTVSNCFASWNFPKGTITTQGALHGHYRYTMVVTGASGVYVTQPNGILFATRLGAGVQRMVFTLQ
jgi:hypothetical protein